MMAKILVALGIRKDVGAPVHCGANPVYFTYVYSDPQQGDFEDYVFAWHTADHSNGLQRTYLTLADAEAARGHFERVKRIREHASFVRAERA